VGVPHGVDEGGEGCAGVCESREGMGMEEDLLFRHDGAEECEDVSDAELVEEERDAMVGDGDAGEVRGLDHLTIRSS